MEFIENIAALQLDCKDIDENKTPRAVKKQKKTHTTRKTQKTHINMQNTLIKSIKT